MPEPIARAHPEPVVLDIGGSIGALIVRGDAELFDVAVEISPADADPGAPRSHQHFLPRPAGDGESVHAAVFDRVAEGVYTLWMHSQPREHGVQIRGGTVAEVDWRT